VIPENLEWRVINQIESCKLDESVQKIVDDYNFMVGIKFDNVIRGKFFRGLRESKTLDKLWIDPWSEKKWIVFELNKSCRTWKFEEVAKIAQANECVYENPWEGEPTGCEAFKICAKILQTTGMDIDEEWLRKAA